MSIKKRPRQGRGRKILAAETAESAQNLPNGVAALVVGVATVVAGKEKHPSNLLLKFVSRVQLDCNRFVTILQAVNLSISACFFPYPLDFVCIAVYNSDIRISREMEKRLWTKLPL